MSKHISRDLCQRCAGPLLRGQMVTHVEYLRASGTHDTTWDGYLSHLDCPKIEASVSDD